MFRCRDDNRSLNPARPLSPERKRQSARWLFRSAFVAAVVTFAGCNLWITLRAQGRIFSRLDDVPSNHFGVVLGTSARAAGGGDNPFFAGRMRAAAELFRSGKVRHLVLSGDDRRAGNDEPRDMRAALARLGVPENATTLDPGGFSTLDSMARAKELFRIQRMTIITDDFHAERAILLARHFGIDACAYTSAPVPFPRSKKTRTREIGARLAALLDLYVLGTKPNLAGDPVDPPLLPR